MNARAGNDLDGQRPRGYPVEMRTLILALIPGLLLACNNDITASAGTDGSTGGESTGTSDPTSPSSDPTSPTTSASDPTNPTGQTTTSAGTFTSEPPPSSEPGTNTTDVGTDTTADLWAAVLVPAKNQKSMKADQGMSAKTVSAGFNFTADLGIKLKMGTDSEASAGKTVGMIQGQLPQAVSGLTQFGLAKAAKSLTVTQDLAFVNIALTLTEVELMSLVKLAQQFGGGGGAPGAGNP